MHFCSDVELQSRTTKGMAAEITTTYDGQIFYCTMLCHIASYMNMGDLYHHRV